MSSFLKKKAGPFPLWLVIFIVCFGLMACGETQGVTTTQDTTASSTSSSSNPSSSTSVPNDSHPHFGDGMFQVGKDIQPGTYRTRVGSPGCYYARLSGFDTYAVISNDITNAPAVVTIAATDKGFQSKNCGTWTQNLSAITTSKTSFSDGIFIVGTDIEPGTYKNSGSSGCYYARLSGFDTHAVISNDITNAPAVVTIAATDKGFQSKNCGTWTKQ